MADTWGKRLQVTGDPIVDALIAARAENIPAAPPRQYDLGQQIQAGVQAAKDLYGQYKGNVTEANQQAAELQRLALENMKSGHMGRVALGVGQDILAPVAGVLSPLTGAFETGRQNVEYGFGAGPANAFEVLSNIGGEEVAAIPKFAAKTAAKIAEHPELAMMLGPRAKLSAEETAALGEANLLKHRLEQENLINPGAQRQAVTVKTGWSYDPQGAMGGLPAWKMELPDTGATFNPDALKKIQGGESVKLGDLMDHNRLYGYYPHLKDIEVGPETSNARGSYFYGQNRIGLKTDQTPEMIMDTLLHETQHAIQEHEGFARGASLSLMQQYNDIGKEFDRNNATLSFLQWAKNNNKDLKFSSVEEFKKENPEWDSAWQKKWPGDYPTVRIKAFDDKYGEDIDTIFQNIQKENQDLLNESQGTMDALSAYYRVHGENEAHNVGERYRASLNNISFEGGRGIYDIPFETSAKWRFDQTFRSPSDLVAKSESQAMPSMGSLESIPKAPEAFENVPPPDVYRTDMIKTIDNSIQSSGGTTAKLPTALGLGSPYLVRATDAVPEGAKPLFTITTNNKNAGRQIDAIDGLKQQYPDMATDPAQWQRAMTNAYASDVIPAPPYRFMKELQSGGYTKLLGTLTEGQIADANIGFQNGKQFLNAYTTGQMNVEDTGKLFLWGMLSRGVNPYTHEGLFLDAFDGIEPWIKKAADGKFTKEVFENEYLPWASSTAGKGSGQPGAGAMHNLNAFGRDFLQKMGTVGEDGVTPLQRMHDNFSNGNMSGRDIRREFMRFGEGVGIDNKVMSFILLATGRDDVMVIDRIQLKNLWDDGRYSDINVWDGISAPTVKLKDGTVKRFSPTDEGRAQAKEYASKNGVKVEPTAITGSSLAEVTYGARGLLTYEAIEDALSRQLPQMYAQLGRPEAASVGRFHWETWVARSNQEASHGTLESILSKAQGKEAPLSGVYSRQGDYQSYAYGAKYGIGPKGPQFEMPLSTGEAVTLTPSQMQELLEQVKKPKYGIVPKDFKVTESTGGPWYEREGVNRDKLDALIRAATKYAKGGYVPQFIEDAISYGSRSSGGDYRAGRHSPIAGADSQARRSGIKAYAEGGRTMGNNALGNALRMARQHFGFGGADKDVAEGSTYSSNISHETPSFREAEDRSMREYNRAIESGWSPTGGGGGGGGGGGENRTQSVLDQTLTGRQSGFSGAPPVAMPASIGELLGYNRARQQMIQQQQADQDTETQRIKDALAMASVGQTSFNQPGILQSGFPPVAKQPVYWGGTPADLPASTVERALQLTQAPSIMGLPAGTTLERTEMPLQAEMAGSPQETYEQMFARSTFAPQVNAQFAMAGSPYAVTPSAPTTMIAGLNRPAFPHTPTPTPQQVVQASVQPDVSTPFVQPARPITLTPQPAQQQVAQNIPFPVARPEDVVRQAVAAASAPTFVATSGQVETPFIDTSVNPPMAVLPARKTAEVMQGVAAPNVPMPVARPSDVRESNPISSVIDAIKADLAFKEGERINALEASGKTATYPGYSTAADPLAAQRAYLTDIGLNPNNPEDMAKVRARIIQQDGQDKVDYYTKSLSEALFGAPSEDQKIAAAVSAAREGDRGADRTPAQQTAIQLPTVKPPPYTTELSEGNLALPHPEGLSAQQWANKYAGGDINKVHARIKFINGAPTLEYYTV